MAELVYSDACPYCRNAARLVSALDRDDRIELVPIESERGERLVADHHGEFVHAPHLFTDDLVYYGVGNTLRGLIRELRGA